MTRQLASIILDKFSQQADSVRFATGKIRAIYAALVEEMAEATEHLFQTAYKQTFLRNRDIVDAFLDDLRFYLVRDKTPPQIFDDFFKRVTCKL